MNDTILAALKWLILSGTLAGVVWFGAETRFITDSYGPRLERIEAKLNTLICMVRQINDPLCDER